MDKRDLHILTTEYNGSIMQAAMESLGGGSPVRAAAYFSAARALARVAKVVVATRDLDEDEQQVVYEFDRRQALRAGESPDEWPAWVDPREAEVKEWTERSVAFHATVESIVAQFPIKYDQTELAAPVDEWRQRTGVQP